MCREAARGEPTQIQNCMNISKTGMTPKLIAHGLLAELPETAFGLELAPFSCLREPQKRSQPFCKGSAIGFFLHTFFFFFLNLLCKSKQYKVVNQRNLFLLTVFWLSQTTLIYHSPLIVIPHPFLLPWLLP